MFLLKLLRAPSSHCQCIDAFVGNTLCFRDFVLFALYDTRPIVHKHIYTFAFNDLRTVCIACIRYLFGHIVWCLANALIFQREFSFNVRPRSRADVLRIRCEILYPRLFKCVYLVHSNYLFINLPSDSYVIKGFLLTDK